MKNNTHHYTHIFFIKRKLGSQHTGRYYICQFEEFEIENVSEKYRHREGSRQIVLLYIVRGHTPHEDRIINILCTFMLEIVAIAGWL